MSARRPPRPQTAAERALDALEALLAEQRVAMVAGDLPALNAVHSRIHAMLSDPGWRRDAARSRSPQRVRLALKNAAVNAGLAARGEAHAARALSTLGVAPSLYGPTRALGAPAAGSRRASA